MQDTHNFDAIDSLTIENYMAFNRITPVALPNIVTRYPHFRILC